jgi:hypothetical protein
MARSAHNPSMAAEVDLFSKLHETKKGKMCGTTSFSACAVVSWTMANVVESTALGLSHWANQDTSLR